MGTTSGSSVPFNQTIPRVTVDVMAVLGACGSGPGSAAACGSYDHRERCKVHYLWPEGYPVEELLHERLTGPETAVAPDGGRNRRRLRPDGRQR